MLRILRQTARQVRGMVTVTAYFTTQHSTRSYSSLFDGLSRMYWWGHSVGPCMIPDQMLLFLVLYCTYSTCCVVFVNKDVSSRYLVLAARNYLVVRVRIGRKAIMGGRHGILKLNTDDLLFTSSWV